MGDLSLHKCQPRSARGHLQRYVGTVVPGSGDFFEG